MKKGKKVVIVTGSSSGIGKALALKFGREGFSVVLATRNLEKLEEIAARMAAEGMECLAVPTDVSNEKQCREMVEKAVAKYGRIDVLINNAGISMRALFEELDLDVIRRLMNVNFWGAVYCTKFALPWLLKSGGSVVGVSSIAGYKGLPGRTGYSASKFAMQGFLETLRIENMKKDLHVMVACPGFTASNIRKTALAKDGSTQGESPRDEARMMSPDKVAQYIYRGVVKRKRSVILTAEGRLTVLLNKFFPAFIDRMVYNKMAREPDSPFK